MNIKQKMEKSIYTKIQSLFNRSIFGIDIQFPDLEFIKTEVYQAILMGNSTTNTEVFQKYH